MNLKLIRICNSKCSLGEGLYVAAGNIYWVDISEKNIWQSLKNLRSKKIEDTPSVIFYNRARYY
jgi:sugar lactone lactonase YvrE